MGYSIELYFERDFEARLRSLWDELEKAGVPSVLHKIGSRPHVSLLILDRCNAEAVADLVAIGIEGHRKFPITFPAFSIIPGIQQSVCLTPVVNCELIAIQERFFHLITEKGFSVRKHYRPDNWLPHCSISKELSAVEALKTIEVCQKSAATGKTWITEVGFIEFRPRKAISTIGLMENRTHVSPKTAGGRASPGAKPCRYPSKRRPRK